MFNKLLNSVFLMLLFPFFVWGQDSQQIPVPSDTGSADIGEKKAFIYGFVRGGLYGSRDQDDGNPYLSSVFSDFGLKVNIGDNQFFGAFADLRFRYGTEFREAVNRFDIREAYISIKGRKWDMSAGQKIIKWGRADFTNPTSKLSPRNYISRSPDPEDMDLGNLLLTGRWTPASQVSVEAVAVPYFRPSVLITKPISLPSYVTLEQSDSLVTDKEMFSYGLKTDIHLKGIDMSLSWFDGYNPMPGTALTSFNLDLSGPFPVPYTGLTMTPYKIRNIGFDFEATAGSVGFRGEAAWMRPEKSYKDFEYVPCEEIKWVTGVDWSTGDWRFTGEYSGKFLPHFEPSAVNPFIGTEPDFAALAVLIATPGFDMEQYVRKQIGAFNRLYNYQLEKIYHSAGLRIEADVFFGKLTPSLFTLYNFTSRDFLVMPGLKFKPADGLTINVGGEYYSGRKGSIYEIIHEFMNCINVAIRVDF